MEKLLKKFKTKEDVDRFRKILGDRMKNNEPISGNGMIDGMVIGFILTVQFSNDLFIGRHMGGMLEGTKQKLEQVLIWCSNNENELCGTL